MPAQRTLREAFLAHFAPPSDSYWLTRTAFLRALGFIYFLGFFSLTRQLPALIGDGGLLPARQFLGQVAAGRGALERFLLVPTVFWANCSDAAMLAVCWLGVALSVAVLCGAANAALLGLLWLLYSSLVHVGQLFYGYGWEMMLIEAGFLAIFLCPLSDWRAFPKDDPPPVVVMWLVRWMMFRVMFGAGLIKLRGDDCWRDLTCLMYHYETQPIPHPLSWYWHNLPPIFNKLGVQFNHVVELVVPWLMFSTRPWRLAAGALFALFQVSLILSGNLSWLNWLTLALCIPFFDDDALKRLWPAGLLPILPERTPKRGMTPRKTALVVLTAVVLVLSLNPVLNMLSPRQAMNQSFDPFNLVNTYGAFGSVGKRRMEVIIEGTAGEAAAADEEWREYEFKCKPGAVDRAPCVVTPYHHRIDWQIWFAAMSDYSRNPWLVHFVEKLLRGDKAALSLIAQSPFPDAPPRFIRAWLYHYEFTRHGDGSGDWWKRKRVGLYLPPLSLDDPGLQRFLAAYGWVEAATPSPTPR